MCPLCCNAGQPGADAGAGAAAGAARVLCMLKPACKPKTLTIKSPTQVSLVLTLELTLLPALHGCWVDLCMLPLFDAVWGDRMAWFRTSPVSFLLVHWVLGMAFLMGIATFLSILRQQLRPGGPPVRVDVWGLRLRV